MPSELGAVVSTILFDATIILFVGVLPILAVILWNLLRLARQSFWGLSILIVGIGVTMSGLAVYEVITTFWDKPSQSSLIASVALVVLYGGVAIISFGMLVIFVWAMWKGVRMLLARRQARLGGRQVNESFLDALPHLTPQRMICHSAANMTCSSCDESVTFSEAFV